MEKGSEVNVAERIGDWRLSNERDEAGRKVEYRSHRLNAKNLEVVQRWADRWINNAAVNLPIGRRSQGIEILRGAARGLPIVCVGVGPSLDQNIQHLNAISRKCLIVSSDAAVAPLLAVGVSPDIVVNFDCRDEQESMWRRIQGAPNTKDLVLLANSCAAPGQLAAWAGKLMMFNMDQGDDEFCSNILPTLYPQLGSLPNLGTVGNAMVVLANIMEASKIYLVGYDFCYGGESENRYRCTDYEWVAAETDLPARFVKRENAALYNNADRLAGANEVEEKGKKFLTDDALWNYRRILISTVGMLDLPVVNVGGGSLDGVLESLSMEDFVLNMHGVANIRAGESVVPHLHTVLGMDPRYGYQYDAGQWKPDGAPSMRAVADLSEENFHRLGR